MTHSLHRYYKPNDSNNDYIILTMAAQKYNDQGAFEKLIKNLKLMIEPEPVNYGDDNNGGIFTGLSLERIIELASDGAYMAAVYDNLENLTIALQKLKEADNGMSVVVTGDMKDIFNAIKKANLAPHTVNISLGYYGKMTMVPSNEILEISTMCGHGMISPNHVRKIQNMVHDKTLTPEAGAQELAKPCTCALFNPTRAAKILKRNAINSERGEI